MTLLTVSAILLALPRGHIGAPSEAYLRQKGLDMTPKFKWLTGDPATSTDVAAELAGYVKLETLLKNIGAMSARSEENSGKRFERDYPLGEDNGVLLEYQDSGGFGYCAPDEGSWEDEDVMGDGPLYPGFVYVGSVRRAIGEPAYAKIGQERGEKYAAHYRRRILLENASNVIALAWQDLTKTIMDHSGDPKDATIEWSRTPMQAWREAQQAYARIENMTDEEILTAPDPS